MNERRCGTCGEPTYRTFAGARIDGEPVAVVWNVCRHGHLTEDPLGASRIFAAFDPSAVAPLAEPSFAESS